MLQYIALLNYIMQYYITLCYSILTYPGLCFAFCVGGSLDLEGLARSVKKDPSIIISTIYVICVCIMLVLLLYVLYVTCYFYMFQR